jgi:adenosylhomocysteine nucleosidase
VEALLHKVRPRLVISSGFTGAIDTNLNVGDLILAENFSDRRLLETAEQTLRERKSRTVKVFTSASIIDSIAERNEIARASGAAAVDMETGAIVSVCNAHGVPLLSLRVISDTPGQPFPVPPNVLFDLQRQRPNYGRLFAYLLTNPASIPRLVVFGREINRVRVKLTDAIVALVKKL